MTMSLSAQPSCNQVEVKSYSIGEGLSQKMIQNMVQDEDKFVWMATWNGLEKFDGYTFRNFKSYPTDEVRLPYNRLPSIATGPINGLWCETYDSRMFIFDTREERFIDPFALHPGVRVCEEFASKFHLPDGILWLAGRDGSLWRIDGKRYRERGSVRYFQPTRAERGETVHEICPDGNGGEWVLSNHGYWVYGHDGISGLREFRRAVPISSGMLLIGADGSLACADTGNGKIREIPVPHPISHQSAPYVLADGRVAMTNDHGVCLTDPTTGGTRQVELKFAGVITTFHEETPQSGGNILWALSDKSEVMRIDLGSLTGRILEKPYSDVSESLLMQFIHCDRRGEMWIYPQDGHLCHYNRSKGCLERVYSYSERGRRLAPDFTSYMIDDRDNLWGRTSLGIHKITFPAGYSHNLSDRMAECRGLMIDSRGRLWTASKDLTVAIYDSAYNFTGNLSPGGTVVKNPDMKFGASLYVMAEDSRHRLWLGSRNHGLFLATPVSGGERYSIRNYRHNPEDRTSISNDAVYTVYEDRAGRMWIGTYGGGLNMVKETDGGELEFLHSANGGLPTFPGKNCRNVRYITCNSRGEMMVCTSGGFVTFDSRFTDPKEIRFHRNWCDIGRDSTLSNNDVLYAMEDSRHDVYLAIMSGGICKVKAGSLLTDNLTFSYISKRNGLPSDMVYSIREDKAGHLWLALENAICRYDTGSGEIMAYDRFDFHRQLLIGEAPFVMDGDGMATFGLSNAVMQVDLARLSKSDYEPNVMFCDAKVLSDGGSEELIAIHPDSPLTLSPRQRNVSVSFVALDYGNTDNISYAYRLRGFNDHWIDNGHSHTASFYALPAGDYVLEVKSTNCEGAWNDRIYSLPIHIEPTFIETVWAKLLYVLAFLAIGLAVWYVSVYILRLQRRIDMEQELTAMKLKFFTDVSHELRTPLTLIINPIDEVIGDKSLSPSSREYMAMAKSNTDRMLRLINQFLDIRKIQNSKMKIYLERIDAVPLLERIHNDFRGLARQKGIDFSLACTMKECMMYTDVDKLEKIVFNLLSNAFKYTPDGLSVALSARKEGEMLIIAVKDQGPGMEEWQRKGLFKRFETFGRKRNAPSSGIGLSLVKELLDMLHGSITVTGEKGEGCTFEVTVPGDYDTYSNDANAELILKDGDSTANQTGTDIRDIDLPANDGKEQALMSVMVVEDNAELRRMLVRMLSDIYSVSEASDGQEALDRLETAQPDIIISDIMMPRVDGLELLAKVRADRGWSHIPFVLLSAKASVYERIEGLECGADDYLTKPFSASYLRARLRSLIDQRSRLMDHFMRDESTAEMTEAVAAGEADMPTLTGYDSEFVKRLMEYVEREARRADLTIEEMAGEMKLGRTVFNRKVKSLLNCTPVELLASVRLKLARNLLAEGSLTVAEITYKCGFSSPQYFSRVFKSHHGCTPGEFSKKICKQE